ncbi:unnamed protein product [Blepharisma stoltei]|uniref:Uncharacterized protein n=1 Tax=Blepharisma stoltei TaxID=1481888 RepID=A0AAU9ITC7_9CILI|nr:unnamed protein product [Blepharisma stoltei]
MAKITKLTEAHLKTIQDNETAIKQAIDPTAIRNEKLLNFQDIDAINTKTDDKSTDRSNSARKNIVTRAIRRAESLQSSPKSQKSPSKFSVDIINTSPSPRKSTQFSTEGTPKNIFGYRRAEDIEQEYEELYKNYTEEEVKRDEHIQALTRQLNEIKEKYEKLVKDGENERKKRKISEEGVSYEEIFGDIEKSQQEASKFISEIQNIESRIQKCPY